jgi:hypothetical protein
MRKTSLALALLATVGLAAAPGSASAAKKKPKLLPNCAAKKSKTVAQSAEGRVYSIGTDAFICSFKANKRFFIGDTDECQNQSRVGDFHFGNGIVGYIDSSCGLESGDESIVVKSLKTGKTVNSGSPVDRSGGGESSTEISSWAMKPNGSIAWAGRNYGFVTSQGSPPPPPELRQVWKREVGAPAVKLDEGADIVGGSVAVGTSDFTTGLAPVYWAKGTTLFSSTLK